ncbi:hypothetical protein H4R34_003700 [Dimargaris verticillata]|uniref:VHS domain-containing protein n=1 Tax=Dimargaris verticillata TaxID=2761393 RepID=A0A9W8B0C5_9FUNG|nr:hypothetical protein H4R34_003700 [Dimargaris verticillata]
MKSKWPNVTTLLSNKVVIAVDKAIVSPDQIPTLLDMVTVDSKSEKKFISCMKRKLQSESVSIALGSLMVLNCLVEADKSKLQFVFTDDGYFKAADNVVFRLTTPDVLRDAIVLLLDHWRQLYPANDTMPLVQHHGQVMRRCKWMKSQIHCRLLQQIVGQIGMPSHKFLPRPLRPDCASYGVFGSVMLEPTGEYDARPAGPAWRVNDPHSLAILAQEYVAILHDALLNITVESGEITRSELIKEFLPKSMELYRLLRNAVATIPPGDTVLMDRVLGSIDQLTTAKQLYDQKLDSYHIHNAKELSKLEAQWQDPSVLTIQEQSQPPSMDSHLSKELPPTPHTKAARTSSFHTQNNGNANGHHSSSLYENGHASSCSGGTYAKSSELSPQSMAPTISAKKRGKLPDVRHDSMEMDKA